MGERISKAKQVGFPRLKIKEPRLCCAGCGKTVWIPSTESFRKTVEEMVEKSGMSDCIYERCIEEFSGIEPASKGITAFQSFVAVVLSWLSGIFAPLS